MNHSAVAPPTAVRSEPTVANLPVRTGDHLTDNHGRHWTVGQSLGRGAWGRSWVVRADDGKEAVLKVALVAADFPPDMVVSEAMITACRQCVDEQADLLARAAWGSLPRLEGRVTVKPGVPGYILPRYNSSVGRQLEAGLPLGEGLRIALEVGEVLRDSGKIHGNLRPTNILVNDRGEPVLTDVLTPTAAAWLPKLQAGYADREGWRPPEAREHGGSATGKWDTWSLCFLAYASILAQAPTDGRRPIRVASPVRGLDKVELAALKDKALARLAEPHPQGRQPNVRFRSRLAEKLGSLVNRGLSHDHEPSPPYRFENATDLCQRLEEIVALLQPEIVEVGRLLLGTDRQPGERFRNGRADAPEGVFQGGAPIQCSVAVACTRGVTDHEDLACGLQLVDLDAEGDDARIPVHDAKFAVRTHPSGRLRFDFTLPDLPPGRYRLKVAFTVKDSGFGPRVAAGDFEVRPPAGYVPPPSEAPLSNALRLPTPLAADPASLVSDEASTVTGRASDPGTSGEASSSSDPGAEIIAAPFARHADPQPRFPRPLAPPDEEPTRDETVPTARLAPQVSRAQPVLAIVEVDGTSAAGDDEIGDEDLDLDAIPDDALPADDVDSDVAPTDAPALPRLQMSPQLGGPAIGMPMPSLRAEPGLGRREPALTAQPSFGPTLALRAPAVPRAPAPMPPGPGRWDELPPPEDEYAIGGDGLPGVARQPEGEDLPGWEEAPARGAPFAVPPQVQRAIDLVRNDSRVAALVSAGACAVLLVLAMAVLRLF